MFSELKLFWEEEFEFSVFDGVVLVLVVFVIVFSIELVECVVLFSTEVFSEVVFLFSIDGVFSFCIVVFSS